MNKRIAIPFLLAASLLLSACGGRTYTCDDPLGCVSVARDEAIQVGILLTLSGPDAPYGMDALRGVEIAIARLGAVRDHPVELVLEDDQCAEQYGREGAERLAANAQIVAVIGATCSSASAPAAKILSAAGYVMISPSSTAPSLTAPQTRQPGFLRTIYNDRVQGKVGAEFAFNALGARSMVTIHDGTPYTLELQQAACEAFTQLGGECIAVLQIQAGQDVTATMQQVAALNPEVIYFPVYTVDGVAITHQAVELGLTNAVLVSSDGLLSSDFINQTKPDSDGMYLSGASVIEVPRDFLREYEQRYGEQPIATYHAPGYDAVLMLFAAIEKVAVKDGSGTLHIPRQGLRDALFATREMQGMSGILTCSEFGDCATPNIQIYQIQGEEFVPVYP